MTREIALLDSEVTVADVEVGTLVLIDTGVLQGVRGTVLGSASDEALIVMVRLLRETTAFAFPASCLRIYDGVTDTSQPLTH